MAQEPLDGWKERIKEILNLTAEASTAEILHALDVVEHCIADLLPELFGEIDPVLVDADGVPGDPASEFLDPIDEVFVIFVRGCGFHSCRRMSRPFEKQFSARWTGWGGMTPEFLEVPGQETDHAEDVAASQLDRGFGSVFDEGSFLAEMASMVLELRGFGEARRRDDFAYDLGAVVRRHGDLISSFSIGENVITIPKVSRRLAPVPASDFEYCRSLDSEGRSS